MQEKTKNTKTKISKPAKSMPLDQSRMPRELEKAMTSTSVIHKQRHECGVRYYKTIYFLDDGTPIFEDEINRYTVKITRATTEMAGAFPFIFDAICFVCSHAPQLVRSAGDDSSYFTFKISYETFLNICLNNENDMKDRLKSEIYKFREKNQSKIIPFNEKASFWGLPIVINLVAMPDEKVNPSDLERISNLKKMINPYTGKYEEFYQTPKAVGYVEILFLKSLFRDVIEERKLFSNSPKALYVEIIKATKEHFKDKNDTEIENSASSFNRFWHYLHLHDNGTLKPWKDAEKPMSMSVSVLDLLTHVAPQFVQIVKGKVYISRGKNDAIKFIADGMAIFMKVEPKTRITWTLSEDNKTLTIFKVASN